MSQIFIDLLNHFIHNYEPNITESIDFQNLPFEKKQEIQTNFFKLSKNQINDIINDLYLNKEVSQYNLNKNCCLTKQQYLSAPYINLCNISRENILNEQEYYNIFKTKIYSNNFPLVVKNETILNKFCFLYDAYNRESLNNSNVK